MLEIYIYKNLSIIDNVNNLQLPPVITIMDN